MKPELRSIERVDVSSPTFIAVRPEFSAVGRLIDISRKGMRFQYIVLNKALKISGPVQVDIFMDNKSFYLHGIPCESIYDMDLHYGALSREINYRVCGLKFQELSQPLSRRFDVYLALFTADN